MPPAACSSSVSTTNWPTLQPSGSYLAPLWTTDWFVYAKRPFTGPEQVLAYLSRYTHQVAISNGRLISADAGGITFKYKDNRIEDPDRYKTMTLEPGFLMHVLPKGLEPARTLPSLMSSTTSAQVQT